MDSATDKNFAGSIPRLYETLLVPLIFEPYAQDLARRIARRPASRVLEIAAGTGVVTRALASSLPEHVHIVATDLSPAMLDQAQTTGTARPVEWQQADAMALPFPPESFDIVVCQFGAMFFPDKPEAFSEICRVLKPGGLFLFNVWGRIEDNDFADTVSAALTAVFPNDPPAFMARTPHGYHDAGLIAMDLARGGFDKVPSIETVTMRSRAASARTVATAYCQGTPLRNEIEARDASRLGEATDAAGKALAARFGHGTVDGNIQAIVVAVER